MLGYVQILFYICVYILLLPINSFNVINYSKMNKKDVEGMYEGL